MTVRRPLLVLLVLVLALAAAFPASSYAKGVWEARAEQLREEATEAIDQMPLTAGFTEQPSDVCGGPLSDGRCLRHAGSVEEVMAPLAAMLEPLGDVRGGLTGIRQVDESILIRPGTLRVAMEDGESLELLCEVAPRKMKIGYDRCSVCVGIKGATIDAHVHAHMVPGTLRFEGSDIHFYAIG